MGSLTSRPKPPPAPAPVVFVPQPPPAPAPAPSVQPTPAPAEPAPSAEEQAEQAATERRVENLVRRSRGRSGTIRTSLLGVSSDNSAGASDSGRKTLLGQ